MYEKLLNHILENQRITIFRHISPDGDCVFSSLALYYFLKENFKDKIVKLTGNDKFDLISKNDKVSDKFIKESLAIVLDTSNVARIDDIRALEANYIIKIDHHPIVEQYGDLNIVKPDAAATCELLSDILFSKEFSKFHLSNKVCQYLYAGIVTDTLNFKTTNTTANTLMVASKLVQKANIKVSEIYQFACGKKYDDFVKATSLRQCLKRKEAFGYIKLSSNELKKLNISSKDAKHDIDELNNIDELNVWIVATQGEDGTYECSIRSKRGYIINQTAAKYGGGGHANAAGVKGLSSKQVDLINRELFEIANKSIKK